MPPSFSERRLDLKVTAVHYLRPASCSQSSLTLLTGIGGRVHCYSKEDGTWVEGGSLRIFQGAVIHGFVQRENSGDVLVFGGKTCSVLSVSNGGRSFVVNRLQTCSDWILHAAWEGTEGNVILITAHNRLLRITPAGREISFGCEEKCILYSSHVLDTVVLGGTVFQEVIVWSRPGRDVAAVDDAKVLHRLKGHEGVIFSLDYDQTSNTICSTSDDRTSRLWKVSFHPGAEQDWAKADISCIKVLRGHTSRIFRCKLWNEGRGLLTGGEDSLLSVWTDLDSDAAQRKAHGGSPVWALDVDEVSGEVVTGGGDGAVRVWPLSTDRSVNGLTNVEFGEKDPPKAVRFIDSNTLCILTNLGQVYLYDMKCKESQLIFSDESLKGYGLCEVVCSEKLIVLGNLLGEIIVLNATNADIVSYEKQKLHDGKIFSLHLLSKDCVLTCGSNGEIKITSITNIETKSTQITLPKTGDQRWVSCAKLLNKGQQLLIGDRNGSLHLFDLSIPNSEPVATCLKLHGRHGIGDLRQIRPDVYQTSGRDGQIKTVTYADSKMSVTNVSKLPMTWLERFLPDLPESDLMLGFHSSSFVIYSLSEQRSILEVPCGGSHRSWDIAVRDSSVFAFVKDKQVFTSTLPLTALCKSNLKQPFHSREVSVVQHFSLAGRNFIATSGEEIVIKVHEIGEDGYDREVRAVLSGHISNVKAISTLAVDAKSVILASGGGRAQIILWKISYSEQEEEISVSQMCNHLLKGNDKQRKKTWRDSELIYDSEVRFMGLALNMNADVLEIFAGGSDGYMRKLATQNVIMSKLEVVAESACIDHCFLKVDFESEQNQIVSTATDGIVRIYSPDLKLASETSVLLSGINAISKLRSITAVGGDSGAIAINGCVHEGAHGCQVSGLELVEEGSHLISASGDQRLSLWKIDERRQSSLVNQVCTDVADIQDMAVWKSSGSLMVAVAGEGLAIYRLCLQCFSD